MVACVGMAPCNCRRRIFCAGEARITRKRGQRRLRAPVLHAQRKPFAQRCDDVHADRQSGQDGRPPEQANGSAHHVWRSSSEFSLAKLRGRRKCRDSRGVPRPRRSQHERRAGLARTGCRRRSIRRKSGPDLGGAAVPARRMVECQQQLGGHAIRFARGKGGAVRLAHESAAAAGGIPDPLLWRRPRCERRLGHDPVERVGEVGDQLSVRDGRLQRAVAALRRHGDVLLRGRTGQLIFERKGRRGRDAVCRQRRQAQPDHAHARRRKHRLAAPGVGPCVRWAAAGLHDLSVVVEQRPRGLPIGSGRSVEQYTKCGHRQWKGHRSRRSLRDRVGFEDAAQRAYSSVCQTTIGHSRPSRRSSARACARVSPWRARTLTRK